MKAFNATFLFDEFYLLELEVDQFQNNEKHKCNMHASWAVPFSAQCQAHNEHIMNLSYETI